MASARRQCIVSCFASLLLCAAAAWGSEPSRPFVVGHRGIIQDAPENTLPAFRACLALRVGFEFDVRRTSDGRLVCLHDAKLERTTDGNGDLAQQTFAQVRRLDAGSWFDASFRDERVPTVEEILALLAAEGTEHSLIAADMKATGDGIEADVVRLAQQHKALARLVFIGATIESDDVRAQLLAADATAQTARLAKTPQEVEAALHDERAAWVYLRFLPSAEAVAQIHRAGKRVFLAGPLVAGKEPDNWTSAAKLGIDAILTDHPLEMRQEFRHQQRSESSSP
jgi:glycerophosphoryl diester phosphodiesterase